MSWTKGGVVIVKRGDRVLTDAIEQSINIQLASRKELEELIEENKRLKMENSLLRRLVNRYVRADILALEYEYGYNPKPPKWARKVSELFAFVVYKFSVFTEEVSRGGK